jgi:protein-S-isoprenylcysteine O-methyltransferase Ste14
MGSSLGALLLFLTLLLASALSAMFWKRESPSVPEWIRLGAFVAQTAIRMPHVLASRANQIASRRHDLIERIALPAMFLTAMGLPLISIVTPVLAFADYRVPDGFTWVGLVLLLAFLWLFWRSHTDLGRNWSPGLEVREGHTLVTGGVYRRIRHPMYAAIWLAALAQPMLIHNWVGGPLVLAAFAFMCVTRLPREEAMMRQQFGDEYDRYAARTHRLVPGLI